jgi:hypothetical protein
MLTLLYQLDLFVVECHFDVQRLYTNTKTKTRCGTKAHLSLVSFGNMI